MDTLIVGASIAGLATALALQRAGLEARLIERSVGMAPDRGAGLGVDSELLRRTLGPRADAMPRLRLSGVVIHRLERTTPPHTASVNEQAEARPSEVSTWQQLYGALRAAVEQTAICGCSSASWNTRSSSSFSSMPSTV